MSSVKDHRALIVHAKKGVDRDEFAGFLGGITDVIKVEQVFPEQSDHHLAKIWVVTVRDMAAYVAALEKLRRSPMIEQTHPAGARGPHGGD